MAKTKPHACWACLPRITARIWRALERAAHYRAFSWSAVERILAAQARPRSGWESLQADAQEQLDEILRQSPVSTRSTAEYQSLLEETAIHDETGEDDDPSA